MEASPRQGIHALPPQLAAPLAAVLADELAAALRPELPGPVGRVQGELRANGGHQLLRVLGDVQPPLGGIPHAQPTRRQSATPRIKQKTNQIK